MGNSNHYGSDGHHNDISALHTHAFVHVNNALV
jgi:hypothetical protein